MINVENKKQAQKKEIEQITRSYERNDKKWMKSILKLSINKKKFKFRFLSEGSPI